jgi:exopolysaccharide biosynthesis polyprenyl glycosylphosphotransferase
MSLDLHLEPLAASALWRLLVAHPTLTLAVCAVVVALGLLALGSRARRRRSKSTERVVVLETSTTPSPVLAQLTRDESARRGVVGIVTDGTTELYEVVRRTGAERIVVSVPDPRSCTPPRRLLDCWLRGIPIEPAEAYCERITGRLAIEALHPADLLFGAGLFHSRRKQATARALSLTLAVLALPFLLPLFALVALWIKLDSRGPVFFVQQRIGARGRPFPLIKFRTMQPRRDNDSEWVEDNEHRITRAGRVLRRFRIDELPQLLNVLRGEMNLVGPRPHPESNRALLVTVFRNMPECGAEIPYYALRTLVRPGITGWAQVRYGYANGVEQEVEKLRYDLYYVKHWSLWLDVRILFETLRVVLLGSSSASEQPRPKRSVRPPGLGSTPLADTGPGGAS